MFFFSPSANKPRRSASAVVAFTLLTSLIAGTALAQTPAPTAGAHPLIGTWRWALPGKRVADGPAPAACVETLEFHADGGRKGSSGEEQTQATYAPTAVPSLLGFYRVSETLTQSNGKPDCAGDTHAVTGEATERFIQFSPKLDLMLICQSESLKACYGPLLRMGAAAAK